MISTYLAFLSGLACQVAAHYTFPNLILSGSPSSDWQYVRETDNFQSLGPQTDVTSTDFTCYNTAVNTIPTTASVKAGSTVGFQVWGNPANIYHPGVLNVYMANAGSDASTFTGTSGNVWFKIYEISAVTDGGKTITFPSQNLTSVSFAIPSELPSGQYLLRIEAIALHVAQSFAGAQFYIACAQLDVTGGGSGTPGPLVAIPGVYTGNEPGILIDIYYPIPTSYTQPGPAVWPASGSASAPTSSKPASPSSTPVKPTSTAPSQTSKTASSPASTPTSKGTAAEYAQCGGQGWTGATACASPFVCTSSSVYYSQCLPA
ncbi:hypothetical protein GALMADRAFT_227128 [Galerina marginata CBS 339.88]|uniref:lytic cellulose monooxygenase (C4-dehydrogenating) n=1 Tax=Galerina marginata (strain CBS 339.88) TaxID=685588 RepID=A0A067SUS0_GALM3|nr:hypothetical protein GALMADRAFT_227128 [Galerina marginata CBS 339.88]